MITMTFVEGFAAATLLWGGLGLLFIRTARRRVRAFLSQTMVEMKTRIDQGRELG